MLQGHLQVCRIASVGLLRTCTDIYVLLYYRVAIRTEPLGMDRLYRRYWWLQGGDGLIFVESPEGNGMAVITTKQQLDDVIASLNPKGVREHALLQVRCRGLTVAFATASRMLSPQAEGSYTSE